ncbi:MAG: methyltransferase domain-containing protein [Rhodanobacteraceae bacterium]
MIEQTHRQPAEASLQSHNRAFYDDLWRDSDLIDPGRFNTWPLVQELVAQSRQHLEVAPGLRPRLPLQGTHFVDISHKAMVRFCAAGAAAVTGLVNALPFSDGSFDLVCAFDIVEHVEDDEAAMQELARVSSARATLLISVPLHQAAWTPFDDFVGHHRRYEPQALEALLARHGFQVERSAVYGMQPGSSRLLDLGMWFLTHQRERAMWWYNRVIMPLGIRMQKDLVWQDGLVDDADVDTVVAVCRKTIGPSD